MWTCSFSDCFPKCWLTLWSTSVYWSKGAPWVVKLNGSNSWESIWWWEWKCLDTLEVKKKERETVFARDVQKNMEGEREPSLKKHIIRVKVNSVSKKVSWLFTLSSPLSPLLDFHPENSYERILLHLMMTFHSVFTLLKSLASELNNRA